METTFSLTTRAGILITPYSITLAISVIYSTSIDNPKLFKGKDLTKAVREMVDKLAEEFDMKSFMYQKIENLSTGQTQRVNLARCVVHNPNYYILDEATSGLDTILSQIILNFIKKE